MVVDNGASNTSGVQEDSAQMPDLKLHGQTPIVTNAGKRLCTELSPLVEMDNDELVMKIDAMIEKAFTTHLPKMIEQLKVSLEQSVKNLVEEHIKAHKNEMKDEMQQLERHNALRVKCQSEVLESYNRRDNLRILGIASGGGYEENQVTEEKVIEIAKKIDANVASSDISIAHRLPSRKPGAKPIIVRFARRIARINMMNISEEQI